MLLRARSSQTQISFVYCLSACNPSIQSLNSYWHDNHEANILVNRAWMSLSLSAINSSNLSSL